MDLYLDRFERLANEHRLESPHWPSKLSHGLRGKAYDIYSRLPADQITDYEAVKRALLQGFELTGDCYRKKFRLCRRERGESYAQFAARLSNLFDKWVSQAASDKTYDGLTELLLFEQLRETMTPELRTFTAEQGAERLADLVTLADRYVSAHSEAKSVKRDKPPNNRDSNQEESIDHNDRPYPHRGYHTGHTSEPERKRPAEKKRYCSFCNRNNHSTAECFKWNRREPESNHTLLVVSEGNIVTPSTNRNYPPVTETVQVSGQSVHCLYAHH